MRQKRSHNPPRLKIKRGLHGLGLVSLDDIPKGRFVVEYTGKLVDDPTADSLNNRYIFEVKKNLNIDGSSRTNLARYVNHACWPNCEDRSKGDRVFYYSKKFIPAGEELTVDYGKEYFDYYIAPHGCRCGARTHRYGPRKKKKTARG